MIILTEVEISDVENCIKCNHIKGEGFNTRYCKLFDDYVDYEDEENIFIPCEKCMKKRKENG